MAIQGDDFTNEKGDDTYPIVKNGEAETRPTELSIRRYFRAFPVREDLEHDAESARGRGVIVALEIAPSRDFRSAPFSFSFSFSLNSNSKRGEGGRRGEGERREEKTKKKKERKEANMKC